MGRDHAAVAAKPKGAKSVASPSLKPHLLPTSPKNLGSPVSTAASTPQTILKSPKSSLPGGLDNLDPSFHLPDSVISAGQNDATTCTVCNGQDKHAAGTTITTQLYSCQNPHHSHHFFTCSQKCNKKFEKECARVADAKRKQQQSFGKMPCPRCHHPMTSQSEVVSVKSGSESTPKSGPESSPKVASQDPFLPSTLLPSKSMRQAPPRSPQGVLDFDIADIVATSPVEGRRAGVPPPTFFDPTEADADVEVPEAELEDARLLVKTVEQEVAELEKQLESLTGKEKKKERNETNKRIFSLRNSSDVLAAQRLVRDPVAECRRRKAEAQTKEAKVAQQAEVKEVVRASLAGALNEGREKKTLDNWKMLLKQGLAVGLTKDDEVISQVSTFVEALEQEAKEREEVAARQKRLVELEEQVRATAKALVQIYANELAAKHQEELTAEKGKGKGKGKGKFSGKGKVHPWHQGERTGLGKGWGKGKRSKGFGKGKVSGSPTDADSTHNLGKGLGKARAQVRYKMDLCRAFQRGQCPYGAACTFAHGVEQLRGQQPQRSNPSDSPPMAEQP